MSKNDLREKMRHILPLPAHLRGEKSRRICDAILLRPEWVRASRIAIFAPQQREPDVELLWEYSTGKRFAYPRIDGDMLGLYSVDSPFELRPAKWGIREPLALPENVVSPDVVDVVLVPGVAFTRTGLRCGRGGGFYDRLLASLPASTFKIGVCFDEQLVEEVPIAPHDIPVDIVVSA